MLLWVVVWGYRRLEWTTSGFLTTTMMREDIQITQLMLYQHKHME